MCAVAAAQKVDWVQTARFSDDSVSLLKEMPALKMEPLGTLTSDEAEHALIVDSSRTYQEILGFGGAFTEASAVNWMKLSKADRDEVIRLYFAPPEEGGLGYTLGRVPSEAVPMQSRPRIQTTTLAQQIGNTPLSAFLRAQLTRVTSALRRTTLTASTSTWTWSTLTTLWHMTSTPG